jgi:hypothetical protein
LAARTARRTGAADARRHGQCDAEQKRVGHAQGSTAGRERPACRCRACHHREHAALTPVDRCRLLGAGGDVSSVRSCLPGRRRGQPAASSQKLIGASPARVKPGRHGRMAAGKPRCGSTGDARKQGNAACHSNGSTGSGGPCDTRHESRHPPGSRQANSLAARRRVRYPPALILRPAKRLPP